MRIALETIFIWGDDSEYTQKADKGIMVQHTWQATECSHP